MPAIRPPRAPHRARFPRVAARLLFPLAVFAIVSCDGDTASSLLAPPAPGFTCSIDDPTCVEPNAGPVDRRRLGVVSWQNEGPNPDIQHALLTLRPGATRLPIYWEGLQRAGPNTLDSAGLATIRSSVADVIAAGGSVYISLEATPAWARGCERFIGNGQDYLPNSRTPCPTTYRSPPADSMYPAWQAFVRMMIDSLPQVHDWAVWNEPNAGFLTPLPGSDPISTYATLVRWAAPAVHSTADGARRTGYRLLGPELGDGRDERTAADQREPHDWLRGLLAQVGDSLDVVTVHRYGTPEDITLSMQRYAQVMHGLRPDVPLWLTEVGHGDSTRHEIDSLQAGDLTEVYRRMLTNQVPRWERTYWFSLFMADPRVTWYHYSLTRNVGRDPRPAFECLRQMGAGVVRANLPPICRTGY